MNEISASQRSTVIGRAGERCEYCHLAQIGQEAAFHIDHVQPRAANGPTTLENLALACVSCSLRKAAKEKAVGPITQKTVPLFNPRDQKWDEHFRWEGVTLHGKTTSGRATVSALAMNRSLILAIRKEEMLRGRHPT